MTISVHTRLTRKYMHPAIIMVDPYTEDRDGFLYLVSQDENETAIQTNAIIDIEM